MAKFVCTLEMSKDRGVTITVENAEGKITQTLTMDGTSVTMTVEGEQEKSSVTQRAESITIKCKDFVVLASNSIACTAAKTATYTSTDSDTTIKSGAGLLANAAGDVKVGGKNIAASATSEASLKGGTAVVDGGKSLTLKGATAALSGQNVSVSANIKLALESSAVVGVKGPTTTVSGTRISLG